MLLYIIVGLLFFGLLIAVHEGGHFLAAKALDVRVNEFSIGMGPALFSRQKGETLYSLRIFPMGGYCAMEGEDEATDDPRAFARKALWRKIIILAAGSGMNLLAGFLLVAVFFLVAGSYTAPVIQDFVEGFPCAGEQGLLPGDRILSVNGHRITVYEDLRAQLNTAAGHDTMDLVVERAGQRVVLEDLPLTPRSYTVEGQQVTMYGIYFTVEEITLPGLMSGPVGIVSYLGQAGSQGGSMTTGLLNVCYIIALIAVNLAIMNLLPIPALDGGRIFLLLAEEIWFRFSGQKIPAKYTAWINGVGFVLLILLMVAVTFSDVWKLVN